MSTSTSDPKPPVMGYPAPLPEASNAAGGGVPAGSTAYPYPAPPPHSVPHYYSNPNPNPTSYNAYPNPNSYPSYPNPNPNSYPYYPNPNPYPYQNHNPNSYPPSRNTIFMRRFIILIISFIIIIGAISMITWLVLRPKFPVFSLSSASLSNLNISNSNSLYMDLSLSLTAQNPNKKLSISYSSLDTIVLYRDETLAQTNLSPFDQPKQNTTQLSVRLVAVQQHVSADVAKGINNDKLNANGGVNFKIRVYTWVVFNKGFWSTRRHVLNIYCDDVVIGFNKSGANSGALLGGVKQCTFG